jgi:hypothetical protein
MAFLIKGETIYSSVVFIKSQSVEDFTWNVPSPPDEKCCCTMKSVSPEKKQQKLL